MSDVDAVVILLPINNGAVTYAVAGRVSEGDRVFEAIVAVPDTTFAPPRAYRSGPVRHTDRVYIYMWA